MSVDRRSGSDRRRQDIGPPRGVAERRRGARQSEGRLDDEAVLIIAAKAIQRYVETHPRPTSVTQDQAADMVGVSRSTISRMVKAGQLKLNKFGRIPISEVDKALKAD